MYTNKTYDMGQEYSVYIQINDSKLNSTVNKIYYGNSENSELGIPQLNLSPSKGCKVYQKTQVHDNESSRLAPAFTPSTYGVRRPNIGFH